jgi:hypothetical protein
MMLLNGEEPCDSEEGFMEKRESQIQGETSLSLHMFYPYVGVGTFLSNNMTL